MKNYRKRIADEMLVRKLESKGAVLIEGPKWCGKTTTAEQLAASVLDMDDPEKKEQNISMSELNPKRLLFQFLCKRFIVLLPSCVFVFRFSITASLLETERPLFLQNTIRNKSSSPIFWTVNELYLPHK